MNSLVGYTGFVGSNIYATAKDEIKAVYNSKNIGEAFGTNPDLLIYSGIRAEKYLANSAPKKDMELITQAEENIKKINPKRLVLISTIDVFKEPIDVNELSGIETDNMQAYGFNRYLLELWVRKEYPDALIVRLSGLFGKNIKKNFIYDFINVVPFMLKKTKFDELLKKDPELGNYYKLQNNGFYRVNATKQDRELLKSKFWDIGFSALNFTDSRSIYQFYNLKNLWNDIQIALDKGITLWHSATEPVSAGELYEYLTGKKFLNELAATPVEYNCKTMWDKLFGGNNGYISSKENVLKDIKEFVYREEQQELI